jgi:CBS domain-containing protein
MATMLDAPVRSIDWSELISIDAALSTRAAAAVMIANRVGALVVTGGGVAPTIITERDITRAVARNVDLDRCPCGDAAGTALIAVDADEPLRAVAHRLLLEGIRHIAVARGGQIVSVLSLRDLLRAVLPTVDDRDRS